MEIVSSCIFTAVFVRFVLRSEILVVHRARCIRKAAMDLRRLGEIAVRRRRRRLPFQGGRIPRIVRLDLLAVLDAPEEIDDERNLRQTQSQARARNVRVQVDDAVAQTADSLGRLASE